MGMCDENIPFYIFSREVAHELHLWCEMVRVVRGFLAG
ncbi:hypothetical protein D1BOALGB6SA_6943 [Olavius sp. associated proteobacterium Delta 1]|nr:hypothetical protein D1BOALGB6SA_6943 [Olavius sp. associated proteobacterium Delta 1]